MASLGAFFTKDGKVVRQRYPIERSIWQFDEDDLMLMAMLADPIYCAELLGSDPGNREYGGCFVVRDYQWPMFRTAFNYVGHACARTVGKTESIKWKSVSHAFRRIGENLLLTAPELIHLLPLTDAVEDKIRSTRLTRDFLECRGGKTGFTHRPFGVDFIDGTKIVGRIPRVTGPQPLDAKILTPTGWTTMGEIAVGDRVVGSDGFPTEVLQVHEQGERPIFRLEFNNGATARACGDHRWLVRPSDGSGEWRMRTTAEMGDDFITRVRKQNGGPKNRWQVPRCPMVEYDVGPTLPLDPYVVGVFIGDGGLSTHTIFLTSADPEIVDAVAAALPGGCSLVKQPGRTYHYYVRGLGAGYRNPLVTTLTELGLMGCTAHTKRIPETYMRGSVDDRLALLQGLIDTDGTVGENGRVTFATCSQALARQVAELVRTLGGWASMRSQYHKPYEQQLNGAPYLNKGGVHWRVGVSMNSMIPCRLPRKLSRWTQRSERHVVLKAIVPVGVHVTRCISVDADDSLYVTGDCVLTLNTGVKGQHQPDLIVEEGQDYPEKGWIEVHETVMKDTVDIDGNPDFFYQFYGVHSGARDTGFAKRAAHGAFKIIQITALQRPGWGKKEKQAAKAAYGGTSAPDYRRNILGEPGAAASAYFVTSRLVACVDQDRETTYNLTEYAHQTIKVEEFDELMLPIADVMDLPAGYKELWAGMDVGLTNSPTVIMLFARVIEKKVPRMKLIRRFTLERMRTRQIREATYAIANFYGKALKGFGMDVTGLGFPMWQEMEDDEAAPPYLMDVARGYFFNAKVAVNVNKEFISTDGDGRMRDQFGASVISETDPMTGVTRYITFMPMIEASTRYLREWVDSTFLMLPFDTEITSDMQGETQQRVKRISGLKNKPNAFHVLDAMRTVAMVHRAGDIEEALAGEAQQPVLDLAL